MSGTYQRQVQRVLWIILAANLTVAAIKLFVGLRAGALSAMADAFHSGLDASANVIGLVGIALASRPPDRNHPYGHRKYEAIAALILTGLLVPFMSCGARLPVYVLFATVFFPDNSGLVIFGL